jgi:hypothetical protein
MKQGCPAQVAEFHAKPLSVPVGIIKPPKASYINSFWPTVAVKYPLLNHYTNNTIRLSTLALFCELI